MSDPIVAGRVIQGRVLAAVAVCSRRRLPSVGDLQHELPGVTAEQLDRALLALEARGLIAREEFPSQTRPLFEPPLVCYRPVALQGGLRNHG